MSKEFNEETKTNEEKTGEQEYAFKNVLKKNPNKRTWSVVSIVLAVLAILLVPLILLPIPVWPIVCLVLAILAIGAAALSRVNIGYFDKLSLAGLIIGIFDVVFSVAGFVLFDLIVGILFV